jgi:hypothetical protein
MLRTGIGAGSWRKLSNEELYNCTLQQTINVMKLRIMRWAGYTTRRFAQFYSENLKAKDRLLDWDIDGKATVQRVLKSAV